VALTYTRLWMVEAMFRSMKSLLSTRPIWHQCDATIRGHVFCTYLALVLQAVGVALPPTVTQLPAENIP